MQRSVKDVFTKQCKGDYRDDPDRGRRMPESGVNKPGLKGKYLEGVVVGRAYVL